MTPARRSPTEPAPGPVSPDPDDPRAILRRHRHRLRRIVAIRLAARLDRLLADEETCGGLLSAVAVAASEPGGSLLERLAGLLEREVAGLFDPPAPGPAAAGEEREARRTLALSAGASDGGEAGPGGLGEAPVDAAREVRERLIDACVAGLEPALLREALVLRDYCGASWELVRSRLGLLSVDAARELYRRAHGRLARLLAPHLRPRG